MYDPNGISKHPTRTDINIYRVAGAKEAALLKAPKTFNMVILGGFLKVRPIVELENVKKGLKKSLPARHHHMMAINESAILRGMEIVEEVNVL